MAHRRVALALASQATFAASNVGVTVFAAAALSPSEFGRVSLALIAYLVLRGPIVAGVAHAALVGTTIEKATILRSCAAAGCRLGTIAAGAGVVAGVAVGAAWLVVLSAALPFILSFEVARVVALGVDEPDIALRGDLLWLSIQVAGTVIVHYGATDPPITAVLLPWLLGGVVASISHSGTSWLRSSPARLDLTLAVDDLLAVGLQRLALAAGALVVSATAVAQTRLAIVPFNIVAVGLAAQQPMVLRDLRTAFGDMAETMRIWARFSWLAIGLTVLNLAALLIGLRLFADRLGENFTAAATLLWWVAVLRVTSAATMVLSSTVKAHPDAGSRDLLVPRAVQGLLAIAMVLGVGALAGQEGIAIGLALSSLGGVVIWAASVRTVVGPVRQAATPHQGQPGTSAALDAARSRSRSAGRSS